MVGKYVGVDDDELLGDVAACRFGFHLLTQECMVCSRCITALMKFCYTSVFFFPRCPYFIFGECTLCV